MITREDLISKAEKYMNSLTTSKYKKYKEGYIFDENKSVKWNREEVERLNNLRIADMQYLRQKRNKLYKDFVETVISLLKVNMGYSNEKAIKIFEYVFNADDGNLLNKIDLLFELLEVFA